MFFFKENVPLEYHYNNSDRIAPIVAIADPGYLLEDRNITYTSNGNHGYNNSFSEMRAIFAAHGPNFRKNKVLVPFQNINVYPLLCKLLNIKCQPNNGTAAVFDSVYINSFSLLDKVSEIWKNLLPGFNHWF